MKKKAHKLVLSRETLQRLEPGYLSRVPGGAVAAEQEVTLPSCIDGCPSTPRQCDPEITVVGS